MLPKAQEDAARTAGMIAALERFQFGIDGNVRRANQLFLDRMGYTLEEVVGQHHRTFCKPEFITSDAYRTMWERLREGEIMEDTFARLTEAGRNVWLQASYNPILDAAGRHSGIIKLATEVTEVTEAREREDDLGG